MNVNQWLKQLAHNYVLIVIAAVLFFVVKAIVGYFTYRHYDRKITRLEHKLDQLMEQGRTEAADSIPAVYGQSTMATEPHWPDEGKRHLH